MANEHDIFFRSIQGIKENAIDLIQATFPEEILDKLDLSTLNLDKESYIRDDLREYYTDLVYNCVCKDKNIKISILFEHKSFKPDNEYIQLLRYILNIWDFEIRNKKPFSVVLPVIFYHGEKEWIKREFYSYFGEIDRCFYRFIPQFEYILTDLNKYDDKKIKDELFKRDINRAFSLLLKYIFNSEELKNHLEEIFEIMRDEIEDENERHYLIKVLSYLFNVVSDIEIDEIKNKLEKISKIGGEVMTTIAMKLKEKGKIEEKIETARAMKKEGLDLKLIAKVTGLSIEEIEKL